MEIIADVPRIDWFPFSLGAFAVSWEALRTRKRVGHNKPNRRTDRLTLEQIELHQKVEL